MRASLAQEIEKHVKDWNDNVVEKVPEIDPGAEHDWHTLAIGFFLGRGFNGDDSHELALELLRRNML